MLPLLKASQLPQSTPEARWLIEGLWAEQAVGIIGGEPKSCKSFLALDLAVAVASGACALGRFQPRSTGPVLLVAAEDALPVVRQRLETIAAARHTAFDRLDIHVVTAPSVRLDVPRDRAAIEATLGALAPRLLVLDPFVRLHRIDENLSAEVAPLLAFLRQLQRQHGASVMLVHHARKGGAHLRAGQALRGSSELHAWGDSNLFLRRRQPHLELTIEHRAAASPPPLCVELAGEATCIALRVIEPAAAPIRPPPTSPLERVEDLLRQAPGPLSLRQLRSLARMRTSSLSQTLATLTTEGRVARSGGGYQLRLPESPQPPEHPRE